LVEGGIKEINGIRNEAAEKGNGHNSEQPGRNPVALCAFQTTTMEESIALPRKFESLRPPPAPVEPASTPSSPLPPPTRATRATTNIPTLPTTATTATGTATNNHHPTFHLYSRFWRDRNVFDVIADEMLWNICVDRTHDWRGSHFDGVLRAWSCGSSTGEEVYSLSMMWEYHYQRLLPHLDAPLQLRILGSDRSQKAIKASESARYSCHSLHDLPAPLFDRYTTKQRTKKRTTTPDSSSSTTTTTTNPRNPTYYPPTTEPVGHYTRSGRKQTVKSVKNKQAVLSEAVTSRCSFLHQDFNHDIPDGEGPFDLILARYSVLLYSPNGIDIIANIIHQGLLRPGGYLVVGMSDTICPQVADWLQLVRCGGREKWEGDVEGRSGREWWKGGCESCCCSC